MNHFECTILAKDPLHVIKHFRSRPPVPLSEFSPAVCRWVGGVRSTRLRCCVLGESLLSPQVRHLEERCKKLILWEVVACGASSLGEFAVLGTAVAGQCGRRLDGRVGAGSFYKQWKLLEQTPALTSGRYNDRRIVSCGQPLSTCGVRELAWPPPVRGWVRIIPIHELQASPVRGACPTSSPKAAIFCERMPLGLKMGRLVKSKTKVFLKKLCYK